MKRFKLITTGAQSPYRTVEFTLNTKEDAILMQRELLGHGALRTEIQVVEVEIQEEEDEEW